MGNHPEIVGTALYDTLTLEQQYVVIMHPRRQHHLRFTVVAQTEHLRVWAVRCDKCLKTLFTFWQVMDGAVYELEAGHG